MVCKGTAVPTLKIYCAIQTLKEEKLDPIVTTNINIIHRENDVWLIGATRFYTMVPHQMQNEIAQFWVDYLSE